MLVSYRILSQRSEELLEFVRIRRRRQREREECPGESLKRTDTTLSNNKIMITLQTRKEILLGLSVAQSWRPTRTSSKGTSAREKRIRIGSPLPEVLKYVNLYEGIAKSRERIESVSLFSQACFYMHPALSLSGHSLVSVHSLVKDRSWRHPRDTQEHTKAL